MSVTTQTEEYKKLRQYLNPYLRGKNVSAVLNALATSSAYLVNSVQAVNDSLYVVTAQGNYLDLKLSDYGISRDPTIGLSDEIFRTVGIQVKNRKQVRDLINNILDAVFGDEFVKATSNAQNIEPYHLIDGDTLIVNFDGAKTSTITFRASQFSSIAAATAQEVANAIAVGLSSLNTSGSSVLNNDGNGNYVQLISSTIGASSSVTVLGGRAQNVLFFPSEIPTTGNFSTQWSISPQNGGLFKFTWSANVDPNLGKLQIGDYVNIFGGGFASSGLEGSFPIVSVRGGAPNVAYFEVQLSATNTGIITQGSDTAIQFFRPTRETILDKAYYAAVYQTESNILQIFMPATTQIMSKSRIGSAHLHGVTEQPVIQLVLSAGNTLPSSWNTPPYYGPAEYFLTEDLGTSYQYYIWLNVSGGSNTDPGLIVPPLAGFTGIEVTVDNGDSADTVASKVLAAVIAGIPGATSTISEISANVVDITIVNPSTVADAGPSTPNSYGPYVYDTQQGFVVGGASTTLTQDVNGQTSRVITVQSSVGFPDSSGYLIIGYGTENQEGPIPYIATPSAGTLLISPAYFIQQDHPSGSSILLVTSKAPIVLPTDGSFYEPFLTDTANGRVYAQKLINTIAAAGITVIYTILYPNDIGLGSYGTKNSEVSYVYGP